jgi:hypothetical protein
VGGVELSINALNATAKIEEVAFESSQTQFTALVLTTPLQRTNPDFIFGKHPAARNSSAQYAWGIYWGSNQYSIYLRNSSSSVVSVNSAGVTIGTPIMLAQVYDGVELTLYRDGKSAGSATQTGSMFTPSVTVYTAFCGWGASSTIRHAPRLGAIFSTALTEEENSSIAANPWQLFRAEPTRIYSFPSGAITPVLSAASFFNRTPEVTLTF